MSHKGFIARAFDRIFHSNDEKNMMYEYLSDIEESMYTKEHLTIDDLYKLLEKDGWKYKHHFMKGNEWRKGDDIITHTNSGLCYNSIPISLEVLYDYIKGINNKNTLK